MSAIAKEFFHRRADITITGVNLRVVIAFTTGTCLPQLSAGLESVVRVLVG